MTQNGQAPLQYNWSGPGGASGSGQITDVTVPLVINNLPAGNYTITVTDGVGHEVTNTVTLLAEHFPRRSDDKNELPDAVERD